MYKFCQQFRVLGSQKANSGRPKDLASETHHGQSLNKGKKVSSSFVQFALKGCRFLPHSVHFDDKGAGRDASSFALNVYARYKGYTSAEDPDFPYELRGVVGAIVNVRRKSFLLVFEDHVDFSCRRSEELRCVWQKRRKNTATSCNRQASICKGRCVLERPRKEKCLFKHCRLGKILQRQPRASTRLRIFAEELLSTPCAVRKKSRQEGLLRSVLLLLLKTQ